MLHIKNLFEKNCVWPISCIILLIYLFAYIVEIHIRTLFLAFREVANSAFSLQWMLDVLTLKMPRDYHRDFLGHFEWHPLIHKSNKVSFISAESLRSLYLALCSALCLLMVSQREVLGHPIQGQWWQCSGSVYTYTLEGFTNHAWCLGPLLAINMVQLIEAEKNGRHFPDDIFKCIFLNENVFISIKISLKFVPKDPINKNPALVLIMAWCLLGERPLSELMVA